MSLVAEVVKHAEKSPKIVSLVLLGLIAIGGLAGGLWINNLQASIEYRDRVIRQMETEIEQRAAMAEERLSLVRQMHAFQLASLERESTLLSSQTKLTNQILKESVEDLDHATHIAESIDLRQLPEPQRSALGASISKMKERSVYLRGTLEKIEMVSLISSDMIAREKSVREGDFSVPPPLDSGFDSIRESSPHSSGSADSLSKPLVSLGLVLLLIVAVLIGKRRVRAYFQRNRHSEAEAAEIQSHSEPSESHNPAAPADQKAPLPGR